MMFVSESGFIWCLLGSIHEHQRGDRVTKKNDAFFF